MEEASIVFLGHKNHGKSTTIARLLLDTGSITESRFEDVREIVKASGKKFEIAHLVDSFRQERERAMTMDTTSVFLKGKQRTYQLIDVPGHQELVSQMLTGAAGAQSALLVVSVSKGIEEQTTQHVAAAHFLGIEQLGVVVNKMDAVLYKKEPFEHMKNVLMGMLRRTGYEEKGIIFFPISALEGDNVVKKSPRTDWYVGPSLFEFLEQKKENLYSVLENLPLRFLVQDVYKGKEEVWVGKVETGTLREGQEIFFAPGAISRRILSIKDSDGVRREARAGENIGIVFDRALSIVRGSIGFCAGGTPMIDDRVKAEIFWIEQLTDPHVKCECGFAQVEGVLKNQDAAQKGQKSVHCISLEKPLVFDVSNLTMLGKIVIKKQGKIIGIGNIINGL